MTKKLKQKGRYSSNHKNKGEKEEKRGLSRKDREQLEEYGSLGEPTEDKAASGLMAFDGKVKRVIDETIEVRKKKKQKPNEQNQKDVKGKQLKDSQGKDEDDDEDWKAPDPYNALVKSLKKKPSKDSNPFLQLQKSIQVEPKDKKVISDEIYDQEDHIFKKLDVVYDNDANRPVESDNEDENQEAIEETKGQKNGKKDVEKDPKNKEGVKQGEKSKKKAEKKDNTIEEELGSGKAEDNEEEGEKLTEAEDKEAEEHDEFWLHFGEEFSKDIQESRDLLLGNEEKWESKGYIDEVLGMVTVYDVLEVEEEDLQPTSNLSQDDFFIKKRIQSEWLRANQPFLDKEKQTKGSESSTHDQPEFTEFQRRLLGNINRYKDLLFTYRNSQNVEEIRNLIALHALNHVSKTRDKILKNTMKLNAAQQTNTFLEERDQGFTRPKVLILLPFRNSAYEMVNAILALANPSQKALVENKKRFKEAFTDPLDIMDPSKPADWRETFAGNIDDCFRIGIKFTRRSIKLFTEFYSSDIIIASPLGLRLIVGAEGEKKREYDFLSSIEVLVVDECDKILMQNWDHLLHIVEHVNLQPQTDHGTDILRIRNWVLDDLTKNVRQTLLFSSFIFPEVNAMFNRSQNIGGKVKITKKQEGAISKVVLQIPQIYHRINCNSPVELDDKKYEYFKDKIMPDLKDSLLAKHTCIFFSSYFDYVRVRNHFKELELSFASICEYTPGPTISRARSSFFHNHSNILLYTERFHFFRRPKIRGIRHVIFYGVPEHCEYYAELLNLLQGGSDLTCACLFSKYDRFKLERIVGSDRVQRMISSDKQTFMFI